MNRKNNTIWQKLEYLRSIFIGFSLRHIRYCAFTNGHLIVNDNQKWAYLVHDQGTVVSSEMAFEEIDYERAVEKLEDVLVEIEIDNKLKKPRRKPRFTLSKQPKTESFYEFLYKLKRRD
jgi:hypothetical protein